MHYLTSKCLNANSELTGMPTPEISLSLCFLAGYGQGVTSLDRGLSSSFNVVILQSCFSPDTFLCRLPWSIWPTSALLGANPPLHNCSLGAKGYCPHFCGLLPAVFLTKTLLHLQTLSVLLHSLPPRHFTCFLPSTAHLCSSASRRDRGWVLGERSSRGVSSLARPVIW